MQSVAKEDALLRPEEVAALLSVSPHSLAVWRSTKRYPTLRYIKVGSSVRYRRSVVEAFVAARESGGE